MSEEPQTKTSSDPVQLLAKQIAFLRMVCGMPSIDEIATRTESVAHGRMKRATVNDKLTGRSAPSLDQLVAFHRACCGYGREHGHQIPADLADPDHWRKLWYDMVRAKAERRSRAIPPMSAESQTVADVPTMPHAPGEEITFESVVLDKTVDQEPDAASSPDRLVALRLPVVPITVASVGFGHLQENLRQAGLAHIGELLRWREPTRFRVLDGIWVGMGEWWTKVDAQTLARARGRVMDDQTHLTVPLLRILDVLDAIHKDDPMGLRRLLLFQLAELLHADPRTGTAAGAIALGVDPSEAATLAYSVTHQAPELRENALEALQALQSGETDVCERILSSLPADEDHGIGILLQRVRKDSVEPTSRNTSQVVPHVLRPSPVHAVQVDRHSTAPLLRLAWVAPEYGELSIRKWPDGEPPQPGSSLDASYLQYPDLLSRPWARRVPSTYDGYSCMELTPPAGLYWLTAVTRLDTQAVAGRSLLVHVVPSAPQAAAQRVSGRRATVMFSWPEAAEQMDVRWVLEDWILHRRIGTTGTWSSLEIDISEHRCEVTVEPVGRSGADVVMVLPTAITIPPWRPS